MQRRWLQESPAHTTQTRRTNVRGCENVASALWYSTLYETQNPGDGFPGYKNILSAASLWKAATSTCKRTDGTKLNTALTNPICAKRRHRDQRAGQYVPDGGSPPEMALFGPQFLFRLGGAGTTTGATRSPHGRRPPAGGHYVLHCRQLRGQKIWSPHRNSGRRGQTALPRHRAGRSPA